MPNKETIKKLVEKALSMNNNTNDFEVEIEDGEESELIIKIRNNGLSDVFSVLGEIAEEYDIDTVNLGILHGDKKYDAMLQVVISP